MRTRQQHAVHKKKNAVRAQWKSSTFLESTSENTEYILYFLLVDKFCPTGQNKWKTTDGKWWMNHAWVVYFVCLSNYRRYRNELNALNTVLVFTFQSNSSPTNADSFARYATVRKILISNEWHFAIKIKAKSEQITLSVLPYENIESRAWRFSNDWVK